MDRNARLAKRRILNEESSPIHLTWPEKLLNRHVIEQNCCYGKEYMLAHRISDNITLRLLQAHHARSLFDLVDSNREHLRAWLPWLDKTLSEKDTAGFISGMLSSFASTGAFACGIWQTERLSGVVGYNRMDSESRIGYIGYWLSKDAEGKGIMTDCCRALIKHGFEECGLNRIVISVATCNIKSQAIPDRLGFSKEGVLRDAEWLYDHYVDHTVNAILANDEMGTDVLSHCQSHAQNDAS